VSEYIQHLQDVFARFGPVRGRRMFGGSGIYRDDVMFGLVADDTLYLKVDPENEAFFEEAGLPSFVYRSGEKSIRMSYRLAPDAIFDDPVEAAAWAERSYAAGQRALAARGGRGKQRKGSRGTEGRGKDSRGKDGPGGTGRRP